MASIILDQLDTFGPDNCPQFSYDQATAYVQDLAKQQYENFTVVSWLLPKRLREDFRHVYAFCRWADDLGDEVGDPQRSLQLLDWWQQELNQCYAGSPRHPVFVALSRTIEKHDIPQKPFDHLIDAFVQDQTVTRYESWEQVLHYCQRSADPVGRLVLYLCGYRDETRQQLSDATCTALQLTNFWQDVRRDVLERDRVYIPQEIAGQHGLSIEDMVQAIRQHDSSNQLPSAELTQAYQATVNDLVDRTWPLFKQGHALWPMIDREVRVDIELFSRGGEAILRAIEGINYNTLHHRPSLSKFAKSMLLLKALLGKSVGLLPGAKNSEKSESSERSGKGGT